MNDMSQVIVPRSDQQNADDYISGPRTIKITKVAISPGGEQPVAISFEGDEGKPWKPCKSMSRVLVGAWGPDAKAYTGRSVTLYRDPKVKWGGLEVGGIRISHMSDIEKPLTMALTETRASRKPFTVKPLGDAPPAPTSNIGELRKQLTAAAEQGVVALRAEWEKLPWNDLPPGIQDALTSEFAGFKEIATKADQAATPQPEEPTPEPARAKGWLEGEDRG